MTGQRHAPSSRHMGQMYGMSSSLRPLLKRPQIWCTQRSQLSHCTQPSSVSSSFRFFSRSDCASQDRHQNWGQDQYSLSFLATDSSTQNSNHAN